MCCQVVIRALIGGHTISEEEGAFPEFDEIRPWKKFGQSCERKTMKEEGLLIHGNEQRGNLTGFGRAVKNLTERNKIWLELFVC